LWLVARSGPVGGDIASAVFLAWAPDLGGLAASSGESKKQPVACGAWLVETP